MKKLGLVIISAGVLLGWGGWSSSVMAASQVESQASIRFVGQSQVDPPSTDSGKEKIKLVDEGSPFETPPAAQLMVTRAASQSVLPQTNEQRSIIGTFAGSVLLILLITFKLRKRGTQS